MLGPLKNAAMRLGIPRRAKFEGFLSHRLGQQLGGRVVVHPERLQHPGIRQEGARALAIEGAQRSEEHTSELQSLMRISYAVFCLKKKTDIHHKAVINISTLLFYNEHNY